MFRLCFVCTAAVLFIALCGRLQADSTCEPNHVPIHEAPNDNVWNETEIIEIVMNQDLIYATGNGVKINGSTAVIKSPGTYSLSGTLRDGQIIVNSDDDGVVRLIFNGIDIRNSSTAPVYIKDAEKTIIILKENTCNYLQDGRSELSDIDEPNAVIFSKDNLSLYGPGELTVVADVNDGIACNDGLIIDGGILNIDAIDDGIRGKDYLVVRDANMVLVTGGDGLKSNNDVNDMKGYIRFESGFASIDAEGDAISSSTDFTLLNGILQLRAGGGYSTGRRVVNDEISTKGIKAGRDIRINNGELTINTYDDAIHADASIDINDGLFNLSTADDAIHAVSDLHIHSGNIHIITCYEGIESTDANITINGGTIHVTSSDDGINAAGGGDSMGGMGGARPGDQTQAASQSTLYMNGGYLQVLAGGDGIDINGSIVMTNGTVLVNGPTEDMNGALDYDSAFEISGGFLLAAGSSGMAQAPGTNSSQCSLLITFNSTLPAGTLVHLESNSGQDIFTFAPQKTFRSIAFSSTELTQGASYSIYYGGSVVGTETDGLYFNGTYSSGTLFQSFTINSVVTMIGTSGNTGGMPTGPGGRDNQGGMNPPGR